MRARITEGVLVAALAASASYAQVFRGRARFPIATANSFDGAFQYCRAMFRGIQGGDGGGWTIDYPDADLNFSTRLGELTKTPISKDKRTGEPNHLIVPLTRSTAVSRPHGGSEQGAPSGETRNDRLNTYGVPFCGKLMPVMTEPGFPSHCSRGTRRSTAGMCKVGTTRMPLEGTIAPLPQLAPPADAGMCTVP
jgi:hypothetical protein